MKHLLLFSLSLFSLPLLSQSIYRGKVIDENKSPLPLVNVIVVSKLDSSFITGTTTDERGMYELNIESAAEGWMKFSAIGYQTLYTELRSDTLTLPAAAYGLDEISIAGKRPVYRMKGTGFITDVSNSLLNNIGSANDVLKQLPGVRGDDGKFEVFGKGSATIYINDRLVRDETELERLSSKDIASIELINNPGAKYDAEVRAVLKIKTKQKREGFASRLRLRGTQNHCFSDLEQLNLSYATEKYHWYGNLFHNAPRSRVDGRSNQQIHTTDTLYNLSINMMDWKQRAQYYTLESGVGVKFNPRHEIGSSYTYQYSEDSYKGDDREILSADDKLIDKLSNYSSSKNAYHQHAVNLYYIGKIHDKVDITLNTDYINRKAESNGIVTESGIHTNRTVTSLNNSLYNLYAAKLAINYLLGSMNLEGGMDYSYMDYDQDYLNIESYLPTGWFTSKEQKVAGFFTISGKFGALGWNAGLRYEYFHARYYEDKSTEPTVNRTYKEVYPTLSLSLPVDQVNFSLVYSKRTARPSFYQLRNGIEYTSRFIYSEGNPYLRSSQLHDVSLNAGYRFLQMSVGYYYTKDRMILSDKLRPGDPLTVVMSHKNVSNYQGVSAMLTFQHKIGRWNPSWTAAVYKNLFDIYDYKHNKIKLDHPYGYFSINNMLALPGDFILNVDGYCITAGNSGETWMKPVASMNVGIRKTFFKGALSCDLQVLDIFKSSKQRSTIYTEHVDYYRWGYQDSRMVRVSVVYNFNSYKKKYRGSNSAQDEIRRM